MSNKLSEYKGKRDFKKTREPIGEARDNQAANPPIFVIQKHAASHLHYDFRLESEGVLLSWAVPKGPSMDAKIKRLAMQTENHPLEYANFEGIIPKGEYGGGTVMVWDKGSYKNLKSPGSSIWKDWEKGRVEIWLEGKKISGGFAIIRMKGDDSKEWLLIKLKDEKADVAYDPVRDDDKSVLTGKNMEEIKLANTYIE